MSAHVDTHSSRTFVRFNASERIEHIVLMLSFGALGFTGLIQRFNQGELGEAFILLLGGIETVRYLHRISALIMAVVSVAHLLRLGARLRRREIRPTMLPTPKDVVDALHMVQYYVGRRKEPPLFDRFDFRQKFEYWALIWGNLVMGVTGFAMWFPVQTTKFLPGEVIVAAKAAHGAEAILAVLSILVWHMYMAHMIDGVFPMDRAIFTGKISEKRMVHEHPLEYTRLMEAEQATAATAAEAEEPTQV